MEFIINLVLNESIFNLIILPILIFLSRVIDVSFGTIRVIFVSQGMKNIAGITAFFEIFIWIMAAKQVLTGTNDSIILILAYCFGYATGTYVGIVISEKLSIGKVAVRLFLKKDSDELIEELKENNFGITIFHAQGKDKTHSQMVFSILNINLLPKIIKIIKKHNPNAFYSVEAVKKINDLPIKKQNSLTKFKLMFGNIYSIRKAK